jgi:two-component system chemotaxis response regulator CheY
MAASENNKKILVVDDSDLERELLIEVLKGAGVKNEFLQARSGEEAIQVLGTRFKEICLILLDWQMPQMSGMEFMEAVVKVPQVKSTPIVMVTASGTDENKKKAATVNPSLGGYVVKPYTPETLVQVIEKYINK